MATSGSSGLERLDPRDREYVARLDEAEREVVVSTILRYQRDGSLRAGDPLAELALHRLEAGATVPLRELVESRPLVLVFGSFT